MIKEYKLFINNEFTNGESTYNVLSPFNSEIVGTVHRAGKSEMLYAIECAEKAFLKSKKLSVYERVTILEGLLDGIKREKSI
ncbi:MAG: aldehyde dehydrogenase, partial [Calditrichia bacterium]|nr:aldehyde dehydrogenase [Calditrichia bacterium]